MLSDLVIIIEDPMTSQASSEKTAFKLSCSSRWPATAARSVRSAQSLLHIASDYEAVAVVVFRPEVCLRAATLIYGFTNGIGG